MKPFLACLLGVLAIAPGMAPAGATPIPDHPPLWDVPMTPFHVIGDVYYVGTSAISSFLIVTPKGDILLDGGLPDSAPMIERNIAALGFKITDVKIMLASHAHYDHAGGLAELKAKSGATLYASAADKPIFEKGMIGFGPTAGVNFPPVKIDHVVADGGTVSLGGVTVTAHLIPGHTPGSTSWSFPVSDGGKTYKALYFGSITVGGNNLVGNTVYPQIADDYRASFAKLDKMDCDVFLAPHGEQFDLKAKLAKIKPGAPNPFIDPTEFHRVVNAMHKDFDVQFAKQSAKR